MLTKQTLDMPFKVKSVSDTGEFEGYGSVFGVKDHSSDIVVPGAFAKSLGKRNPAMLWQHQVKEPIGLYTEVKEDENGLYVKGRLLVDDDPLAKRAHAHLKAGSISGLSIGYNLDDYEYDRDKDAWMLKEIDLWEVSLVTFPDNEMARVSDVKSAIQRGEDPSPKQLERVLRDVGLTRAQAKAFMAKGFSAIQPRDATTELEDLKSAFSAAFAKHISI